MGWTSFPAEERIVASTGLAGTRRWAYLAFFLLFVEVWAQSARSAPQRADPQPQCGHWAVYHAARFCGVPARMDQILDLLPHDSEAGHNLFDLTNALHKLGIAAEGVNVSFFDFEKSGRVPVIAHLTPGHFVAITESPSKKLLIFEEDSKRGLMSLGELKSRWTGKILTLTGENRSVALSHPSIQFHTLHIDQGDIWETGGEILYSFAFKNLGKVPLSITEVKVDCKCVTSRYPKADILPGQGGIVELKYSIPIGGGTFRHNAVVLSNDPDNPSIELEASGRAKSEITLSPPILLLDHFSADTCRTRGVWLEYTGDEAFAIKKIWHRDPNLRITAKCGRQRDLLLPLGVSDSATSSLFLELTFQIVTPTDKAIMTDIYIETDMASVPTLRLPIVMTP